MSERNAKVVTRPWMVQVMQIEQGPQTGSLVPAIGVGLALSETGAIGIVVQVNDSITILQTAAVARAMLQRYAKDIADKGQIGSEASTLINVGLKLIDTLAENMPKTTGQAVGRA